MRQEPSCLTKDRCLNCEIIGSYSDDAEHRQPQIANEATNLCIDSANVNDPTAIFLAWCVPITVAITYFFFQAQRVDETRKLESSSREEYLARSWNNSFVEEMQEASRNAGLYDKSVSFLIFGAVGGCCLAAWICRIMDKYRGISIPPSTARLGELSKMANGTSVLGSQHLPWNYTREAWVCGWKEMVTDPAAAGRFTSPCTRIVSNYLY
ncbi:hypothetical protein D6C88_10118 [Aureobasidium pullulans]|nr:hypothetical protein D6C88_10118 [Aureobasidium pullulans]